MATVLSVSASPSTTSRTARLLRHLDQRLITQGHQVTTLNARTLPAEALLGADLRHPAIVEAVEQFERAEGIVIGTPIYKAAYSGLLKSLLDLLPQYALAGKIVLPLATGGSAAHVLAIDYALRPVLSSMGATYIVPGWFMLDKDITVSADGTVTLTPGSAEPLVQVTDHFSSVLCGRPYDGTDDSRMTSAAASAPTATVGRSVDTPRVQLPHLDRRTRGTDSGP